MVNHLFVFVCQDLNSKEQEKVTEVNKVKVELQEQIGHLQAERTAQEGLREKIAALERQLKGDTSLHAFQMLMLSSLELAWNSAMLTGSDRGASCLWIQPWILLSILMYFQGFLSSLYSDQDLETNKLTI